MKLRLGLLVLIVSLVQSVHAAMTPFQVNDIRLEGLQRVEPGTVFRNFPVNSGELVGQTEISAAMRKLFASGYFEDVNVSRDGDDLVLYLKERPAVSLIRLEGNEILKDEALLEGLKNSGLQEGDVFKRATLDRIRQDLLRLYVGQGRYGASVQTEVEPLPGNRVALNIDIKEGKVAVIQHINIVGNTIFTDEELKELFSLKLPNFWSFYNKDDRYSREKMAGDLERLRSYYLDRGYVNFNIDSTQVSISPDKKHVFITVNVTEGGQYTVREVDLAGEMVIPEDELIKVVKVKVGDVFSREEATESQDKLIRTLGDAGYMFANVSPVPEVHEEDKTISLKYFVDAGKRTYVRRIMIRGNTRTADHVVRRELEQMEAGVASAEDIERSKKKLERTSYFKTVNVETIPVPGTTDQVDLEYTVEEQQSGQLTASVGFSQSDGIIFDLGVQQDNFLGSGNKVGFNFKRSSNETEYSFNYTNPYYTVDGVSRGFDVFYRERDFEEDDASKYKADEIGGGINFGYPIDDFQRLSFGLGAEFIKIKENAGETPTQISQFIADEGDSYANWTMKAGWSSNHLNRGFFPSEGYSQSISLDVGLPGSDLSYYKALYRGKWYWPIDEDQKWLIALKGNFGYGDSIGGNGFPFYKNYYAGGLRSVRGYKNNTIGPRDSNGDAFGGNLMATGSAEFIFPTPFVGDQASWRTLAFIDAGTVHGQDEFCDDGGQTSCDEDIRYSVGVGLSWLTPFGPLSVALAAPLNKGDQDEDEIFQFALGSTF